MRALLIRAAAGESGLLEWGDVPDPEPEAGEILVRVRAAALNRADLLQRRGKYPAPQDAPSRIPGLECAGEVLKLGPGVSEFRVGERVMALLSGGGQAELAVIPVGQVMRVPEALDWIAAGAFPEAFLTAHDALVLQARLGPQERCLITAAASGVGLAAAQIARAKGAHVAGTCRSGSKLEALSALGSFDEIALFPADPIPDLGPIDLLLDLIGAGSWPHAGNWLRTGGRAVILSAISGAKAEVDLGSLLTKRLKIYGSVLRSRSRAEKGRLTAAFIQEMLPLAAEGLLHPVLDRVYPIEQAQEAYRRLESNQTIGKVVLSVGA